MRLEHPGNVLLTPSLLIRAGLHVPNIRQVEILPPYVSCQDVETKVTVSADGIPVANLYVKVDVCYPSSEMFMEIVIDCVY